MGSLSLSHWLVVFLILLILFGSSRIAGVGKGFGEGLRALKKGLKDEPSDAKQDAKGAANRSS